MFTARYGLRSCRQRHAVVTQNPHTIAHNCGRYGVSEMLAMLIASARVRQCGCRLSVLCSICHEQVT